MWIRKSALEKVGLLDEKFFMYGEDIDLSYRIQKAGFENWYLGTLKILHYKGESTNKYSYVFMCRDFMVLCEYSLKNIFQKPIPFMLLAYMFL